MSSDERAIRKLVDTWMAASRAGDTAAVLALMADDIVFMVPGRDPFGKDAFAAASQGMQGFEFDGKAEIRELDAIAFSARDLVPRVDLRLERRQDAVDVLGTRIDPKRQQLG